MKLKDFFNEIINIGIKNDPRGTKFVKNVLKEKKEAFKKLSEKEKKYFDKSKLDNPYSDSRIYHGKGDEEISSIMVGVDIETPELLLLDKLREKGKTIDLAMTHHPEGKALLDLPEVMNVQADVMNKFGVPINIAEGIMNKRIKEVGTGLLPINYSRAVDAARLLDIPFIGAHTPCDNCVAIYLQKMFDAKKPYKVGDVIDLLLDIEEYKISYKDDNGPRVVCGAKEDRAGKVYVDMTGGTEGPAKALEELARVGVGTIVAMHMSKAHLDKAKANNVKVIIAGHMASDAVGINLLLDDVEKKLGTLKVIECSGFKRLSHSGEKTQPLSG